MDSDGGPNTPETSAMCSS